MFVLEKAVARAIALMRSDGCFYLRVRGGVKASLWRLGERRAFAPVNRDWLSEWLDARSVENPYTVATAIVRADFKGDEFTKLKDDVLELVTEAPAKPKTPQPPPLDPRARSVPMQAEFGPPGQSTDGIVP